MSADWNIATLIRIQKRADDARKEHKAHGHYCPMRDAINSIYDMASSALKIYLDERTINTTLPSETMAQEPDL